MGEEVVACKVAVEGSWTQNAKEITERCDGITRESGLLHAQDHNTFEQGGNDDLRGLRQRRVLTGLVQVAQTQESEPLELAGQGGGGAYVRARGTQKRGIM